MGSGELNSDQKIHYLPLEKVFFAIIKRPIKEPNFNQTANFLHFY